MTDQETIRKVREALDRAKNRRQEIEQKIRELRAALERTKNRKQEIRQKISELRAEMEKEDVMILSCLEVLDDMREAGK